MKITTAQRRALQWLKNENGGYWAAAWWGGKPHCGWPKAMPGRTFDALRRAKMVTLNEGKGFDRCIAITEVGKAAIFTLNQSGS